MRGPSSVRRGESLYGLLDARSKEEEMRALSPPKQRLDYTISHGLGPLYDFLGVEVPRARHSQEVMTTTYSRNLLTLISIEYISFCEVDGPSSR